MKILLCLCGVVAVATLVLADVKDVKDKLTEKNVEITAASDKSSDSKPKRDAPLLGVGASYHGPSYKYLPPGTGASSYDSYSGGHHGVTSGFGGGYTTSGIGGHATGFGGGSYSHSSAGGLGGGFSSSGLGHSSAGSYGGHSLGHHSSGHHGVSSSGLGYVSSGPSAGHGHHHHGLSSSGLGYATLGSGGHHGISSTGGHGHYSGHGLSHHAPGIKGYPSGPSYTATVGHAGHSSGHVGHSAGPSYSTGHGYATSGSGSSGIGYKGHSVSVPTYALSGGHVGSSAGANTGYHYSKGISGGIPSSAAGFGGSGFGSSHGVSSAGFGGSGFGSSHGLSSAGGHHSDHSDHLDHSDHIHNGNQEHHYVVAGGHSSGASFGGGAGAHGASFGGAAHGASSASLGSQGGYSYEAPAASYLPPVQQHAIPASSYGVPIATVGDSYTTNYHSQEAGHAEQGPVYAAGHKGLGHFGFTANKPQVLHTSISGSSFKQPAYSKAPFKPSTFLGSKFEGSAHNEAAAVSQQYLPPSSVSADSSGYDYPIPSVPSVLYQEPQYQPNNGEATPIYEPESTYLPPNHSEASYNDIPSDPSSNYLPPAPTYGVPYTH